LSGTIDLLAFLREPLQTSVTVLCLGIFDSFLSIDKNHQIALDYQI